MAPTNTKHVKPRIKKIKIEMENRKHTFGLGAIHHGILSENWLNFFLDQTLFSFDFNLNNIKAIKSKSTRI